MPRRRRIIVLHLAGQYPLGGIGYQAVHHVLGLVRLGHDAYYVEDSSAAPYDPRLRSIVGEPTYGVEFLRRTMERFGLGDRWVYHDITGDRCYGLSRERLEHLYRESDALINVCGATWIREEHLQCPVRIYLQTDPVHDQVRVMENDASTIATLEAHTHHFTYGVNLGRPECPVPIRKFEWRPTLPPVVLDLWEPRPIPTGAAECFTTVATWQNRGKDVRIDGQTYSWSKHDNFLRIIDLPALTRQPIELALENLDETTAERLLDKGWRLAPAYERSHDTVAYEAHIHASRGEFTVAKDLVARTRCGWFSDRSVCYLAAGKPVVTQDTGFDTVLPIGQGLFAFATAEEAAAAFDEINRDYPAHCRAARDIAREHLDAGRVLAQLCRDAGL